MLKLKQHRSKQQCHHLERGTQFSKIVCSHYCFECGYGCAAAAGPPPPSGQGQQQRRRLGPSPSLSSAGGVTSAEPRSPWFASESSGRRCPATKGGVHGCSSVMSVQALHKAAQATHEQNTEQAQSRNTQKKAAAMASERGHTLAHTLAPPSPCPCPHTLRLPRSARALELLSENASRR